MWRTITVMNIRSELFAMGFSLLCISSEQVEAEMREAWGAPYSPAANASAMKWLESRPLPDRIIHLLSRLAFRGIYLPQMKRRDWARVLLQNRSSILKIILQALKMKRRSMMKQTSSPQDSSTWRNNTHVDPARRSWGAGE